MNPVPAPSPRQVTLHLRKSEKIFRVMNSAWAEHKGSLMCWRLISKVRVDGRIEAIHFIHYKDGSETVSAHIVLPEAKFGDLLAKIREAIEQFVPAIPLEVGELSDFDEIEFGPYFVHDPEAEAKLRARGINLP